MATEKPILFSGPMVKAILAGEKTQTRRVVRPQLEVVDSPDLGHVWGWPKKSGGWWLWPNAEGHVLERCPYGQPGTRLWVRETWGFRGTKWTMSDDYQTVSLEYRADGAKRRIKMPDATRDEWFPKQPEQPEGMDEWEYNNVLRAWWKKWRPSIHMPKWATRLWPEVVSLKVERVQDITEEDAKAEGAPNNHATGDCLGIRATIHNVYRRNFALLWDSINAKPRPVKVDGRIVAYVAYPWDQSHPICQEQTWRGLPLMVLPNPWVWVIKFKRLDGRTWEEYPDQGE